VFGVNGATSIMRIYLVRHGEAVSDGEDPRRPLSPEGRRQVESVTGKARQAGVSPRHIFHSPKLRARETAEILARGLFPNALPNALPDATGADIRSIPGISPDDDPASAAELAEVMAEDFMIVGHLPHLPRLVGLLTGQSLSFSTATMVCLEREGAVWCVKWIVKP
jgi:phosphohistidine phosphatase